MTNKGATPSGKHLEYNQRCVALLVLIATRAKKTNKVISRKNVSDSAHCWRIRNLKVAFAMRGL